VAVDWGLVLGAVGVVAIPTAIGIGVTMANPTSGEFQFARGCFIGAALLSFGSLAWLSFEHPLTTTKIIVAALVGAASAVALVVGLDWINRRENASSTLVAEGQYQRPYMMLSEAIASGVNLQGLVVYLKEGHLIAKGSVTGTSDVVTIPQSAWAVPNIELLTGNLIFPTAEGRFSHWEDVRMDRAEFKKLYPNIGD
jgi:hypothetical protein